MRLLLLITDLKPGGTPLRLVRLARRLRGNGVDVHVASLAPRGELAEVLEREGIPTFACGARSALHVQAIETLRRHVSALRPDLIHATLFHANIAARFVGQRTGVPVLTSTATIEVERRWHAWLERATGGLDAGQIVNSPAIAEHVVRRFGTPAERVFVVPPSLDPLPERLPRAAARQQLGWAQDEPVAVWAGRLDPVKRVERIIAAAEHPAGADWRFMLAGDGPLRPLVSQHLSNSPARSRVALLGWRDDLDVLLSAADALVLPSLTEGVPNVVLEALACGAAVLASDLPTLRALRADGAPLALLPDATGDAIARALSELAALPENDRAAQADAAAAWARRHLSPERTIEALLSIYQRVVGRGR